MNLPTLRIDRRPDPYARVPKELAQNQGLSFKAKGIAAYLCSLENGASVSAQDLIKASTDGRDSVMAGIKELRDAGYITRIRKRNARTKQIACVKYVFCDYPQPENPAVEPAPQVVDNHPRPEKPLVAQVSQVVDNHPRPEKPGVASPEKWGPQPEKPLVAFASQVVDSQLRPEKPGVAPISTIVDPYSNNPPNPPSGGNLSLSPEQAPKPAKKRTTLADKKRKKFEGAHTEGMLRLGALYGRDPKTKWTEYEAELYRDNKPSKGEVELIESFYAFRARATDMGLPDLWKHQLSSLLCQWMDQLDRARNFLAEHGTKPPPPKGEAVARVDPLAEPSGDWRAAMVKLYPNTIAPESQKWNFIPKDVRREIIKELS